MKGYVDIRQDDGTYKTIMLEPVFLTPEEGQKNDKPTLNGKFDARCIVCLERCYAFWVSEEPPPAGCMAGHVRKEDCLEHAVPQACTRAVGRYLIQNGFIK